MKKNQSGQQPAFSLPLVLLIVMSIVSVYFFIKYQQTKNLLTNPNIAVQTEIKKLVGQIGKLIELPTDEVPSMATVTDKNKLTNQAFFAKAQNGDKILLYQKNHKAILYRPSINKIIEVSLVSSNQITPVAKSTPTIEGKIKLAIYNGSNIINRASITEKQIMDKFPQITVVKKTNAQKTYPTNSVIDLKGNQKDLVKKLADYIVGEVISLPQNEATPEADILIILGKL